MKSLKRYDLHIHSKYSYDSLSQPQKIVKVAIKKGLNGIAITDHNTISGAVEARRFSSNDFEIIVGAEYSTECGDVTGLFLNEEISGVKKFDELVDEIRAQGGIVVLNHPCRGGIISEEMVSRVDAIEVFNSRSKENQNRMANELASVMGKSKTAGSDSHMLFEIGNAFLVVKDDVREAVLNNDSVVVSGHSSAIVSHGLSFGIQQTKRLIGKFR